MCTIATMQTLPLSAVSCLYRINSSWPSTCFSFANRYQTRWLAVNVPRKRRLFVSDVCQSRVQSIHQPRKSKYFYSHSTSKRNNTIVKSIEEKVKEIPEPSRRDLKLVALNVGVPFIGFGIMDNALLIVAGDAIDASVGVALNISTMCAAALGNIVSDLAGVMFGTVIEDFCAKIGLPTPKITEAQRTLRSVRYAGQLGCAIGLTIGCFIGMFPLLFINSKDSQRKKKAAHMDRIFRDAVTEAKRLIQAETITLFLLRDTRCPNNEDDGWTTLVESGLPFEGGKYLWAKYADGKITSPTEALVHREIRVPVGRGVMNRVIQTGEAINIVDPLKNTDFDKEFSVRGEETRHLMIVPIKNPRGEIIGLLQAVNKIDDDKSENDSNRGFTLNDLRIVCSLASHMSVYLLNVEDEEKISLKDTIQLLRRHTYQEVK